MASSQPHLRNLPSRHARTQPRYQEVDTESDLEIELPSRSSRPIRSSQRVRTYCEDSDSSRIDSTEITPDNNVPARNAVSSFPSVRSSDRGATHKRKYSTRSRKEKQNARNIDLFGYKRRKVASQRPTTSKLDLSDTILSQGGNIPAWQCLEYNILVKIFKFAAYPLYTTTLRSNASLIWLVRTSWLCRSFHDAGMSVLMLSPPLYPADIAHSIVRLLSTPAEKLSLDYNKRVKCLDIEVKQLLVRKSGIDLDQLLRLTPLLAHLRIFHEADEFVGRALWADPTWTKDKWSYGNLFNILDEQKIHLQSFEWNGRFQDTYEAIQAAHCKPCLSRLRSVTIVNLLFSEKQEQQRISLRNDLIFALACTSYLTSIEVRNSNILDAEIMQKLVTGLDTLKIVNCLSLTSSALESYLRVGGSSLQNLHLAGNQVMDLGFIADLKSLCPQLQQLYIDLTYLDASSYDDRDPLFDDLLPSGSPTWPQELSSIIIGPLRSLSVRDAEEFYTSLVRSAPELRHLRTLSIKTLLKDGSWRDRARLRQVWAPLFDRIFLARQPACSRVNFPRERMSGLHRRSTRIQGLEEESISEGVENSDHDLPDGFVAPIPMQNACNVVEFELSDQRPAKDQFKMDDFMDAERSGDDEYN